MWKKVKHNVWLCDVHPWKMILERDDDGEFSGRVEALQADGRRLIDRRSFHAVVYRDAKCRRWNHVAESERPWNRATYAAMEVYAAMKEWLAEISRRLEAMPAEVGFYDELQDPPDDA